MCRLRRAPTRLLVAENPAPRHRPCLESVGPLDGLCLGLKVVNPLPKLFSDL